jgi:hypothetical protein
MRRFNRSATALVVTPMRLPLFFRTDPDAGSESTAALLSSAITRWDSSVYPWPYYGTANWYNNAGIIGLDQAFLALLRNHWFYFRCHFCYSLLVSVQSRAGLSSAPGKLINLLKAIT